MHQTLATSRQFVKRLLRRVCEPDAQLRKVRVTARNGRQCLRPNVGVHTQFQTLQACVALLCYYCDRAALHGVDVLHVNALQDRTVLDQSTCSRSCDDGEELYLDCLQVGTKREYWLCPATGQRMRCFNFGQRTNSRVMSL